MGVSLPPHNVLSPFHLDSMTAAVTRGGLIVGVGATPKWTLLTIGAANSVLVSDGTDATWSTGPTVVSFTVAGATTTATSGTVLATSITGTANPSSTSTLVYQPVKIAPTINFSAGTPGAGSYEALKIAVTETALPTGTNYLIRASAGVAGATDIFTVRNTGRTDVAVNGGIAFAISVAGQNSVGISRNSSVGGLCLHGGGASTPGDSNPTMLVLGASGGTSGAAPKVYLDTATVFGWMNTNVTQSQDTMLVRASAAVLQLGIDVNGAAVSQMFQACNGITGTDKTGGDFTLASGKGTGAGAVSSLIFQTPTVLGSGTTAQSLATRLTLNSSGLTIADAMNVVLNATTGTKVGTANTQKLGFWNATPVVQQLLATGAAHTVDDVIGMLQTIGLCKQS